MRRARVGGGIAPVLDHFGKFLPERFIFGFQAGNRFALFQRNILNLPHKVFHICKLYFEPLKASAVSFSVIPCSIALVFSFALNRKILYP